MGLKRSIFQKKDIKECTKCDSGLTQTFGSLGLVILGVGAILGAGIFVITGLAAAVAGPAVIFSFLAAAAVCVMVALCFAEMASIITVTGGSYTYTQFSLGEIWAWIVGWSVLLQIIITAATVAIGWSSYITGLLQSVPLPNSISFIISYVGSIINLPALFIVGLLTIVVLMGARSSKRVNNIIVIIKLVVVFVFIIVGLKYVNPVNYYPFIPLGVNSIIQGAAMVFFAYLGFEAVATSSEEAINPQKSIPRGIIGSLIVCAVLYVLVVVVMTGMVKYSEYSGVAAPVQYALNSVGANWIMTIVTFGIIAGLTTVILVNLYIIPRVLFSMSRDKLLPSSLNRINAKYNVPIIPIILSGVIIGTIAALVPLGAVFELANMGALTAFIFVAIGIINLRKSCPDVPRKFKCPFVPVLPLITIIICLILILELKISTLLYFGIWTVFGLIIYLGYKGYKSKQATD
jgi:APA family basic amino acid/polyamine antiporter